MLADPSPVTTLARQETARGTVALRRRGTGPGAVVELVVNGAFAMDTADTSTERLLAREALALAPDAAAVVVAGLGLGFTAQQVLADPRVRRVEVVELEPAVVDWVRRGLVPATAALLTDPRVRVHVADVRRWLPERPAASVDVAVLDVDNGPGFLLHRANAGVYEPPFLRAAARALRPGGVLAVWSSTRSNTLLRRLRATLGSCAERRVPVRRGGRTLEYVVYLARRTARTG